MAPASFRNLGNILLENGHLQICGDEHEYRKALRTIILELDENERLAMSINRLTLDYVKPARPTRHRIIKDACIDLEIETAGDEHFRPISGFAAHGDELEILENIIRQTCWIWYQRWIQELRGGSDEAEVCILLTLLTNLQTLNWTLHPFRAHKGAYPAMACEPGDEKGPDDDLTANFKGLVNATSAQAAPYRHDMPYKLLFASASRLGRTTKPKAAPECPFRYLEVVDVQFPSRGHGYILTGLINLHSLRKLTISNMDLVCTEPAGSARLPNYTIVELKLHAIFYERRYFQNFMSLFNAVTVLDIHFDESRAFVSNGFWPEVQCAFGSQRATLQTLVIRNTPADWYHSTTSELSTKEQFKHHKLWLQFMDLRSLKYLKAPESAFETDRSKELGVVGLPLRPEIIELT